MNAVLALRSAILAVAELRVLLRDPAGVYAERGAPADDPGPLVVLRWISGARIQAGREVDLASTARIQVDTWASGVGAAGKVLGLGRALEQHLGALSDTSVGAGLVIQSARLVDDSERFEPDESVEAAADPPWVFSFEVQLFVHEEG